MQRRSASLTFWAYLSAQARIADASLRVARAPWAAPSRATQATMTAASAAIRARRAAILEFLGGGRRQLKLCRARCNASSLRAKRSNLDPQMRDRWDCVASLAMTVGGCPWPLTSTRLLEN